MKKRLFSRRGAAIELAIAVIFLMMALSIILVSIATMQGSHRKKDVADLKDKVERMQVTEDVSDYVSKYYKDNNSYPASGTTFTIESGYQVAVEGNIYTVTSEGNTIVTITIDGSGNIISWN